MIFSSFQFLFLFLPLVLIATIVLKRLGFVNLSKVTIVLGSLYFYSYGSGKFFPFFLGSVLFNYGTGLILSKWHETKESHYRLLILWIGIIANILLLGYYKYADFLISNYNIITDSNSPLLNIVLPIGISFFTFQLIAYLVDSYRGETKEYSFLNYLLFITFFPQLIVGPIVHHKDVVPQFDAIKKEKFNYEMFSFGLFLFFMGCAKKLVIADPLTTQAQKAFSNAQDLNMIASWFSGLSYTVSYYFDLSGYADMAIGLGAMFGIKIPDNFNSPYKARNFAEYWRRWHMTLSKFLGDYIFRNIYSRGDKSGRFYFAIFITFLVSGFWHGAGWTFVVWGVINGLFVIFSHMMSRSSKSLPFPIAWSLTFLGVIITRILFVSDNFKDAFHVITSMFNMNLLNMDFTYIGKLQPIYLIIGLSIAFFAPNSIEIRKKFKPNTKFLIYTVFLIVISLLNMNKVGDFLYFQF